MNQRVYGKTFAVAQLLGSLSLVSGSPHGNPLGLIAAMVLLSPEAFWDCSHLKNSEYILVRSQS